MSKDVPVAIRVYSADGRLIIDRDVMVQDGTNFISIPVQDIVSGTYYINILFDTKQRA